MTSPDPSSGQQTFTVQKALDLALQHHAAGRLPEAESLYQQILQADPNQPFAMHLLGVIAHQVGKNDLAVDLISKALAIKPDFAEAHNNLGNVLNKLKRLEEAVASYNKAITINPDYAEAHNNLGNALKEQGRLEESVISYRKAIAINAAYVEAHNNLGAALGLLGRLEEAAATYGEAIAIKPDFAEAHYNLGNAFKDMGRLEDAVARHREALAIKPNFADAHNNLGNALKEQGHLAEAVASYRNAIAINVDYAEAHNNLGFALEELGQPDDAIASYRKAIAIKPDYAEVRYNLGNAFKEQGRLKDAAACHQGALAIAPEFAGAHLNLSIVSFLQGKLKAGWEGYEWRLKTDKPTARILPMEMWSGSPLHGKSILVYAEQGVGDEIAFASCIGDLLERSPGRLILECDPRLEALFARSLPGVQVHGKTRDMDLSWLGKKTRPDYALPIGSLSKFFRNRVEDFPERGAYLMPHPKLVEKWKKRLAGLNDGLKIGISWRGGTEPSVIQKASIPLLDWKPLLVLNASFINLQYGDVSDEIAIVNDQAAAPIHDWPDNDPLADIDSQAALISCLDLVITVDNATVHLCGALGTKAWVLLEQIPEWRWSEAFGDTSPFYRSIRLFRQKRRFEWGDVMDRAAQSLSDLLGNRS
jgi:tetratricopeptide (TPR) repeat protein